MVVRFELFGYFKAGTGEKALDVDIPESASVTVGNALEGVDEIFKSHGFSILKDGKLKQGVIVFLKEGAGKTTRVQEDLILKGESPVLVLSNLMEGG